MLPLTDESPLNCQFPCRHRPSTYLVVSFPAVHQRLNSVQFLYFNALFRELFFFNFQVYRFDRRLFHSTRQSLYEHVPHDVASHFVI
jgi:hypothetical protein